MTPDLGIFAYVFAISLVAGVLFGLAPALESSRAALSSALKANAGTAPVRGRRLRDFLMAAQVAVSLVLMISGSMLIRSRFTHSKWTPGTTASTPSISSSSFPRDPTTPPTARSPSSVSFARASLHYPESPRSTAPGFGQPPSRSMERNPRLKTRAQFYTYAQANYFQTLRIPMLSGRGFETQTGKPEPVVVS